MSYTTVYLFLILSLFILLWLKYKYSYWKYRGVNGPTPLPFVGNACKIMLGKQSVHDYAKRLYQDFPSDKVVGVYQGLSPALVIRDPELIKELMVKAHDSFNSRGMRQRDDRYEDNLFLAEGETWKILRRKFNPLFMSSKVKQMMPLVQKCVENFTEYVDRLVASGRNEQDIKDLCRLLMLDINGTCCFGVSMDIYSEKQNVFINVADNIFSFMTTLGVRRFIQIIFPGFVKFLMKWYNIDRAGDSLRCFFNQLIRDVVKQRKENPRKNGDLMDLLMELKAEENLENDKAKVLLDDDFVATQAITFYVAGFEPTSLFLGFLLFEMALNQDIQQRLFEEINEVANKYSGNVTFEGVEDMVYLKMVFDEILRKYCVALYRKCTQSYTFTDLNLTIEKGTNIIIPLPGRHSDPKYYKDPEVFDPERFSQENRATISPLTYLPFGTGPRHCVGLDSKDLRIVKYLYWRQTATVRLHRKKTDSVSIQRSVRQGCILYPLLFNLYSEAIIQEAFEDMEAEVIINGHRKLWSPQTYTMMMNMYRLTTKN